MAKLPQTIEMQAPNGAVASGRSVDFTSLGNALQGVGQEIERFDVARKDADQKVAQREVQPILDTYNAEATERWALYDGRTFGQDAVEATHFDQKLAPLLAREDLPPGVRDAIRQQATAARSSVMTRATATAAQVRGQRFAADRDANEISTAGRIYQDAMTAWADIEDETLGGITDPAQIPGALNSAFDALVTDRLASHSPGVAQRARASLDATRVQIVMNAVHGREIAQDAQTKANVGEGADLLVNRIARQPGIFDSVDAELGDLAQALPVADRAGWITAQKDRAAASHLDGLIRGGHADEALAAVEAGKFDYLPAQVLDGVRASVGRAQNEMTEQKAWQQADLRARLQQNLALIAQGGGADLSIISEARGLFKPEEVVAMLTQQRSAALTQPLLAGMRLMTDAQAETSMAQREALAATDAERQALVPIRKMKDDDFALKARDPAAWVTTPVTSADTARGRVRDAWRAFQAQPTPELALAYAGIALAVQNDGHIAEANRRLIPRDVAQTMVADLDKPGVDTSENIRRLATFSEAFGGNQARVMVELSQAGMTPRATGALMHYANDPVALGRYAIGLSAKVDSGDVQAVDRLIAEGLTDYRRTMASNEGYDATLAAARTVASGMIAAGERPREAVAAALKPITGDMVFGPTYAIPRSAGLSIVEVGAVSRRRLDGLISNRMAGIQPVRVAGLTEEQSRRRLRDRVDEGRWVTKPDESGLIYMIDLGGGPRPLVSASGQPVQMTWAEIKREASRAMSAAFIPQ